MRTLLLMILFIVSINGGKAQNTIDNFYVGPYEVDYRGQGDINYRLRKGIDLYEYYGLKKDTIIQTEKNNRTVEKRYSNRFVFLNATIL